jgi:hypothetical protein
MCNWPGGNESDPLFRLQHHKGTTHYFITIHTAVLQKLPVPQLVKKFSASYGTRKFTTAFTNARQLFLSWVRSILPTPQNPISSISVLILSSHLSVGLRSDLFHSGFSTRSLQTLLSPRALSYVFHHQWFDHPNNISYVPFSPVPYYLLT